MPTVGISLLAEGPTDQRFLGSLLRRTVSDSLEECLKAPSAPELTVTLGAVRDVNRLLGGESDYYERIIRAAPSGLEPVDIFFLHADGAGDYRRSETNIIAPKVRTLGPVIALCQVQFVSVIPVREMEAWTLADGDALRAAFKSRLTDRDLELPSPRRLVEKVAKPKEYLNQIAERCLGRRRGRTITANPYLSLIGEYVSLDKLREVPSYSRLADATIEALGIIVGRLAQQLEANGSG